FGLAFCESSGPRLVRTTGTDPALVALAARNALAVGCGHTFLIFLGNAYPVNVLGAVRQVPEVCQVYCATANPVEVIVGATARGRGVLGVVDGQPPLGVEGAGSPGSIGSRPPACRPSAGTAPGRSCFPGWGATAAPPRRGRWRSWPRSG